MSIRPLQFPADLLPLSEMLPESFKYPENESWSVQSDEQEDLVSTITNLRRIWPLIGTLQLFSPVLRDTLRGFAWVEGEELAGVTMFLRRGKTDTWEIGTGGVLPAYRRKGIARQLVEKSLSYIRERGGTRVFLDVIDGNLPAHTLYESLGFEDFSGSLELNWESGNEPGPGPLPARYTYHTLTSADWRPRYELEKRITPERVAYYEPVEEARFRRSLVTRLLAGIIARARGIREETFALRVETGGAVAAVGRTMVSTREKGIHRFRAALDPDHMNAAPYLVGQLLGQTAAVHPGLRIEFSVPVWMAELAAAAEAAGFERRMVYTRMGLLL